MAGRAEDFMGEVVLPRECLALATGEQITTDEIHDFWNQAKERGLFASQVPEEYAGQGLDFSDILISFKQVGRSSMRS